MVERGDEDAERREMEKFLVQIERTTWNSRRHTGVQRSDATPMGCAGRVLTYGAFVVLLISKSFVAFGILVVVGLALSFSAASSWHNKRLALAKQYSAPDADSAERPDTRLD